MMVMIQLAGWRRWFSRSGCSGGGKGKGDRETWLWMLDTFYRLSSGVSLAIKEFLWFFI